jgi:hypothetical protein
MTTIVGRNCKVEVALTFAASIAPTAVTKANPPSCTLTTHGMTDGDAGYWSVSAGMIELDQQACLINQIDVNTFTLLGLDSTYYSTYTAGTFYEAATWGTLSEAAGYAVGGGEADQLDDGRLNDNKRRQVAGFNAAENLTIDVKQGEVDGAALQFIIAAARNGTSVLIKITKGTQVLRLAYGVPSVPGESVQAGQLATGSFSLTVPAYVVKPNA